MAEELAYKRKARKRGKHRKVRFEDVFNMENLQAAQKEARKGKDTPKKYHKGVRLFDRNPELFLKQIHDSLEERTYHTSKPQECDQKCPCGKVRHLTKVPFKPDHIVHHAQMRVTYPTMKKYFYYDSYASIKGKGMHFAKKRVERYIDENRDAGCLFWIKRDFVKFYHNIDQEKAYRCICAVFGDSGIRYVFHEVVTVCSSGLGIGLYPIQPIANLYTCALCRLIMRRCKVRVFIYCDDILIIGRDKSEVWKANAILEEYASKEMEQRLHEEVGMEIIDEKNFCDFVGYRFYFGHTFLRKAMKEKWETKMNTLKDPLRRYQVATSYKGWLMHCNGFKLWCSIMNMKSYKDLQVPKFEDVDGNGKRMLKGQRVSASILTGKKIVFLDAEIGVKSKFKKNGEVKESTLIQVEDNGRKFKFFTDNQKLIRTMIFIKEHNGFPFEGELVNVNTGGGLPDYEIR